MKKMSLKVEDLAVESFDTSAGQPPRGTVVAHDSETDLLSCTSCGNTYCGQSCEWCSGYNTCANWNTCAAGCTGGGGCGTWDTCEPTAPDPVGTCCQFQC